MYWIADMGRPRGPSRWLTAIPTVLYVTHHLESLVSTDAIGSFGQVVGVDVSPHMKPDDTPENFWPQVRGRGSGSKDSMIDRARLEVAACLIFGFEILDLKHGARPKFKLLRIAPRPRLFGSISNV